MPDTGVTRDDENSRYVIDVDGVPAGFTAYRDGREVRVFLHTRIDDDFEGQGLGGALVRAALDDTREQGLMVFAQCPFVRSWIERHPAYQDLVGARRP